MNRDHIVYTTSLMWSLDILGGVNMWSFAIMIVAKTLIVAQLGYMQEQFTQLRPSMSGFISLQNFKMVSCFSILVFSYFNTLKPLLIVVDIARCDKELHQCNEGFMGPRLRL